MKKSLILLLIAGLAAQGLRAQPAAEVTAAQSAPAAAETSDAERADTALAALPAPGAAWTLDDCIGYAQRNNISVQQRALQVEQQQTSLSTARFSRLPNLNASIGTDFSFGRTLAADNTYRSDNQTSGSVSVAASMPLFEGLRINREIKGSKLDLAAAVADLDRAREDVAVNIMTLYLQVLYSREMVGIAERQLALSTEQAARSRELVDTGRQPESTYYESEALRANDALSLTQARNDLQLALLDLSQALNRESAAGFDIATPRLDSVTLASMHALGSADEVYAVAVEERPHVRAERLRLASAENSVEIARSALYPSLSLSGGYGTGIYSRDPERFWTQFRNYSREYVGLSLSIPIFNRRATRNNIRLAQLSLRNQQLMLTDAEQTLRKQIEQAWYNADAAYAKYVSASAALESARVAFSYEEQKAAAGRSTVYDFHDAKTRMEKADSEAAQAKYEFVFRQKILDYYRGRPLTLGEGTR